MFYACKEIEFQLKTDYIFILKFIEFNWIFRIFALRNIRYDI